ncbi:MAG: 50S ribosomal protein L25 [bacterium]|nr:50S ribosomal protein L25 [bacterium]
MLALEIKVREPNTSVDALRKSGSMPAVFYGPKEGATAISIDALKFDRVWKEAGETTVIQLKGVGDVKEILIHDVQFHPVTSVPLHADFYVLEKGKKIRIKVPLKFTGVAPAEKAGNIVSKALHEVEIEVAPAELPHDLPVDISNLANVGDHIIAGQIKLPPSATLISHAGDIVVSITEFKEEKIEEPVVTAPAEGAPVAGEAVAGAEATAPKAGTPKAETADAKKEVKKDAKSASSKGGSSSGGKGGSASGGK